MLLKTDTSHCHIDTLKAEIKQKQDELLELNRQLREMQRRELPEVPVGSCWRSRLLDSIIHVTDVQYDTVFCDLIHYVEGKEPPIKFGSITIGHQFALKEIVAFERVDKRLYCEMYNKIAAVHAMAFPEET